MLHVFRAQTSDVNALEPLYSAYRTFFNPHARREDSRPFLAARLDAGECVVFAARSGETVCGFILLYPLWSSWYCKRIWFLSDLYVDETHRKSGAGRMLVERVKEYARETGASSVMVELPRSEPHLTAFYDALGFQRDAVFELARYHPGPDG